MATERGYMPGAIVRKTAKKYKEPTGQPFDLWAVVEHIAQGGKGSIEYLQTTSPSSSSHFFVTIEGDIYQFASIYERTWANGLTWVDGHYVDPQGAIVNPPWWRCTSFPGIDPNTLTISVEHEGWSGKPRSKASIDADTRILVYIHQETGIVYRAGDTLIRHADISPKNKAFCPGPTFDLQAMASAANAAASVDPLRIRAIPDGQGVLWHCGSGFYEYYTGQQGLRVLGYPKSHEYETVARNGHKVWQMEFERGWMRYDPLDKPWSVRQMLLDEIAWMRQQRGLT